MALKTSIFLLWIISFVYAAPAIVTLYLTQFVAETVVATSIPGTTLATQAVAAVTSQAAAVATTAAAVATSASTSSSGFSWSSFLNSDFLSSWLSYFNIGSSSSSSSATTSAATTSAYSAVVPTSVATSVATSQTYVASTASVQTSSVQTSWAQTSSVQTSLTKTSSTQASTSSSASSGDIYAEMADDSRVDVAWGTEMLDAHNRYRAIHQVGDLSWSDSAYKYAQNVADNYDCLGILTHTHGPFGENLSCGYGVDTKGLEAWYEEVDEYNWVTQDQYTHFTQMVWKGSTSVGCAYKDCRSNNWGYYAICSYYRPGNVIGKNAQNVFPATS